MPTASFDYPKEFITDFFRLMTLEGGILRFSSDPNDPGGQTLAGISRVYWADWEGWKLVDQMELDSNSDFLDYKFHGSNKDKDNLKDKLVEQIKRFYWREYWSYLNCYAINYEGVRFWLFQVSVNIGITQGVRILQESINLVMKTWPNVDRLECIIDGIMGPQTIYALNRVEEYDLPSDDSSPSFLLRLLQVEQTNYYKRKCSEAPKKYIFFRGWVNRAFS